MKIGSTVAVCYDGKWGRRTPGTVLQTKNGYKILVEFLPYAPDPGEPPVKFWFRVKQSRSKWGGARKFFHGYVPRTASIMKAMFGLPGDYYTVWKWQDTPELVSRVVSSTSVLV